MNKLLKKNAVHANKAIARKIILALHPEATEIEGSKVIVLDGLLTNISAFTDKKGAMINNAKKNMTDELKDGNLVRPWHEAIELYIAFREMSDGRIVIYYIKDVKGMLELCGKDGLPPTSITWENLNRIKDKARVIKSSSELTDLI